MKVVSDFEDASKCFVCDDGHMFGVGTLEAYPGQFNVSKRAWDKYLAWCKANAVQPSIAALPEPRP